LKIVFVKSYKKSFENKPWPGLQRQISDWSAGFYPSYLKKNKNKGNKHRGNGL
jgi:hypothetical protein